jgi:selenocysteine lyase/cysteine desulfurase
MAQPRSESVELFKQPACNFGLQLTTGGSDSFRHLSRPRWPCHNAARQDGIRERQAPAELISERERVRPGSGRSAILSEIDIGRVRRDTPGCEELIHFNNAGCSLPPLPVREAILGYLEHEFREGGYETAEQFHDKLEAVYDSLAALIGSHREEVAILESATRAWGSIFHALPLTAGDRILTSRQEYASNFIALLQLANQRDVVVEVVENDETGAVSLDGLRAAIDSRVKLIALTHVPTGNGLVNPAVAIGRIAREAGILYLLDACQSVGQMPVDVQEIGCDFLSATGRKYLRGPRGTAFLYVRRELCERFEPIFLDLHAASWVAQDRYEVRAGARRFETWERSYASQCGLGAAADYARSIGLAAIRSRVTTLADLLRSRLSELDGVTINDRGIEKCGIVTFTSRQTDPWTLRTSLAKAGIQIWVSAVASSRLELEPRGQEAVARASVHYYNTEEEVGRFVTALGGILIRRGAH